MKQMKKGIQRYLKQVNDNGFSLLELVVAVGILLILTVGGLLAYNGIQKNAREAAVASAASEVLTGAVAHQLDNKSTTNAVDAETEWNATSKKDKAGKAQITVKVEEAPTCLKVTATHVKSEQAIRQTGTGCVGGDNGENTGPGDENGFAPWTIKSNFSTANVGGYMEGAPNTSQTFEWTARTYDNIGVYDETITGTETFDFDSNGNFNFDYTTSIEEALYDRAMESSEIYETTKLEHGDDYELYFDFTIFDQTQTIQCVQLNGYVDEEEQYVMRDCWSDIFLYGEEVWSDDGLDFEYILELRSLI